MPYKRKLPIPGELKELPRDILSLFLQWAKLLYHACFRRNTYSFVKTIGY